MSRLHHRFFLSAVLSALLPLVATAGETVNIWEGTAVKKKVMLTPYPAEDSSASVIVCPGGSYYWLDAENEGTRVAEWLQQNGLTAFVLEYRTAHVPALAFHTRLFARGNQYPDAQKDLQQAIAYVKDHAAQYRIDTACIGAMGFSAGGHLALSVAEMYDSPRTRPSFVALLYPVVSFSDACAHDKSRSGLLGEYREHSRRYQEMLSLEKHVPADCPPVFLANCADDLVVESRNSELLDSALTAAAVPHRYLRFETGGHGFGIADGDGMEECRAWKNAFLAWCRDLVR